MLIRLEKRQKLPSKRLQKCLLFGKYVVFGFVTSTLIAITVAVIVGMDGHFAMTLTKYAFLAIFAAMFCVNVFLLIQI